MVSYNSYNLAIVAQNSCPERSEGVDRPESSQGVGCYSSYDSAAAKMVSYNSYKSAAAVSQISFIRRPAAPVSEGHRSEGVGCYNYDSAAAKVSDKIALHAVNGRGDYILRMVSHSPSRLAKQSLETFKVSGAVERFRLKTMKR